MNTTIETKWTSKAERQAIAREVGLNPRQLRINMLAILQAIKRDCRPQLDAINDRADFIASGQSLLGWIKESRTAATLPAWARLQAPPLPVGEHMPPNKCLAPAFVV